MVFTRGTASFTKIKILRVSGPLSETQAEESMDNRSSRREHMMLMQSLGSLCLGPMYIYVQNLGPGAPWIPGVIRESKGLVSFAVKLDDGQIIRQHADHMRVRTAKEEPSSVIDDCLPIRTTSVTPEPSPTDSPPTATEQSLRRSNRPHKSPDRFGVTVRYWLVGEDM